MSEIYGMFCTIMTLSAQSCLNKADPVICKSQQRMPGCFHL
ncbi:hypothetical protein MIZ03_0124 [Rhodoferax lithotrophicus]|uniref:Uncharacterized protein n=1 Tax=Rhodoferax lithotrophicus TaxID=2798804 RepID=A0ABM7MGG0_9BURK|nr:hypothetical protein MIZ03_0124 [Rhodoferax sp. MIZ03]